MNDTTPFFVTTAIPYVNAAPHIGFAMELVQADVIARHQRRRGRDVRFLTGTDENSLKNVRAAEAEGIPTAALVERNAASFRALREVLDLSFDDFIRTSAEARHRTGVEALWTACAASGDIDTRAYRGLYCVGCEQFYAEAELHQGNCPEHGTPPEVVEEENYFFRLSRYQEVLDELLTSGRLQVTPDHYRNEVLAFVRSGLQDFSISRSSTRARGWGIPVPGDLDQVTYVWFDALGNYVTALDSAEEGPLFQRYWREPSERVHVIGKGITRFHAIYWPAILLSAGLPLPSTIVVHGYLTVEGQKIGKSLGNAIDPTALVRQVGADTVRFFLCRHIRTGRDGDFGVERLTRVRDAELADQLGNLLSRTVAMISKYYDGVVPSPGEPLPEWEARADALRDRVTEAFDAYRLDDALDAVWSWVERANRYVVDQAPWKLAKRRDDPNSERALATTLYVLAESLRVVAVHLTPFIPATAGKIHRQLGVSPIASWPRETRWGQLSPGAEVAPGGVLFPKT